VRANYTYLKTKGNFGTIGVTQRNLAGFVPRSYNVGLQYTYKDFGASFDVNYTGRWPIVYSAATTALTNRWRDPWTVMNAGVTYRVHKNATAFLSVSNLAQEGRSEYFYIPERIRSNWTIPRSLKFGVTGQF
jgi:outer membrane receptor for ferrienterochelin and colicin